MSITSHLRLFQKKMSSHLKEVKTYKLSSVMQAFSQIPSLLKTSPSQVKSHFRQIQGHHVSSQESRHAIAILKLSLKS